MKNEQIGNKEYAITVIQGILDYPSMVVPQLDDNELLAVINDALHLYQDKEMSLEILTNLAETVQMFMGMRKNNLWGLLEEIREITY